MKLLALFMMLSMSAASMVQHAATATTTAADDVKVTVVETKLLPTRVTLHLKDAEAEEIFAELGRQANLEIKPANESFTPPNQNPRLDVDQEKMPLLASLWEICDALHLEPRWRPRMPSEPPVLELMPTPGASPYPTCESEGVLFQLQQLTRFKRFVIGQDKPTDVMTVTMRALIEPTWRGLAPTRVRIEEAHDDAGKSLIWAVLKDQPFRSPLLSMPGGELPPLRIQLSPPTPGAKRIAELAGSIDLVGTGKLLTIEVPHALTRGECIVPVGANQIKISAKRNGDTDSYEVQTVLSRGEGASDAQWRGIPEAYMTAQPARLMTPGGSGVSSPFSSSGRGKSAERSYRFPATNLRGDPAAHSLVLTLPMEITRITAKFEFKDLPLP